MFYSGSRWKLGKEKNILKDFAKRADNEVGNPSKSCSNAFDSIREDRFNGEDFTFIHFCDERKAFILDKSYVNKMIEQNF